MPVEKMSVGGVVERDSPGKGRGKCIEGEEYSYELDVRYIFPLPAVGHFDVVYPASFGCRMSAYIGVDR